MPVLAFDMTTANHESRRFEFRGRNKADYYDGDLKPLSSHNVDVRIEKSLAGEYAICKEVSRSGLAFRRSWGHIRNDKTNLVIFWFMRRGHMSIAHAAGRHVVHAGECAITRSTRPFYMELVPPENGELEVMHVVVPSHKIYAVLGDNIEVGRPFPTSSGELALTDRILDLVFEQDDQIDQDMAEQLVQALLTGISKTITRLSGNPPARESISDKRIGDITRYINQNFANPDLNARMVADSCGISLRYLCHVLKKSELSFSTLVWDKRMATAHDWLSDEKMQHYAISEIAYLAGFKSSAHFSRMFKSRYNVAPREFRGRQVPALA
ncbi:AraC family transcriptional regulator [Novosphingobium sp. 9U]|uniref:helix-turn-helix transcriptional regulator n=1 Tax=Novosphingobium sp. 9U TaxID=2653158 RepID=UPI0012F21061|nr:AraC family transcriptional regulator [Novosphingobium sp. 9U]VWX54205.1 AraC-type DNA-binding protein [Novosphingobium sp. 9U]